MNEEPQHNDDKVSFEVILERNGVSYTGEPN